MLIQGSAPRPVAIELNGLFGSFHVGRSTLRINFASTFANPTNTKGHADLVRELKPMRERLEASKITDLRSLLQRDLDDNRVAQDLIPYLLGHGTAGIGFFPAILAVLVPRGYLSDGTVAYPRPTVSENNDARQIYGDCWAVERYRASPVEPPLPLGLLEIYPANAEVIVLDGQHRANAFRYVSGDFDQTNTIYKTFYGDLNNGGELPPFDSDLPVTIIWFEAPETEEIRPDFISRKLFVDVNNSAKRVSSARSILLDDRAATCIGTTQLYNDAARNGFRSSVFSLLHGAFDMDGDLTRGRIHAFAITAPEIIAYALYWGFFGGEGNDSLAVDRAPMNLAQNKDKFGTLFPGWENRLSGAGADDGVSRYSRFYFAKPAQAEEFRSVFDQNYLPVLRTLFSQFNLLASHYDACRRTEEWVTRAGGNSTQEIVWNKVFCGGEGLYWTLQNATNPRAEVYQTAINEVEEKLTQERASLFGNDRATTNQVFDSFRTLAFQTGFVGAVEYLARYVSEGDYPSAANQLVNRLNEYLPSQWAKIFTELRSALVGAGLDPKSWPMYRNVLVRLYDGNQAVLYDAGRLKHSPDWLVYKNKLIEAANAYARTHETLPADTDLRSRASALLNETETLLSECGLGDARWFDHDTVLSLGFEHLRSEVQKAFPDVQNVLPID